MNIHISYTHIYNSLNLTYGYIFFSQMNIRISYIYIIYIYRTSKFMWNEPRMSRFWYFLRLFVIFWYPMTDPWRCYINGNMDPINISPLYVSINIPAPLGSVTGFHVSPFFHDRHFPKERLWISGFGATTAYIARAICPALGAHAEALRRRWRFYPGVLTNKGVENPWFSENDRFFHGGFGKDWSYSLQEGTLW